MFWEWFNNLLIVVEREQFLSTGRGEVNWTEITLIFSSFYYDRAYNREFDSESNRRDLRYSYGLEMNLF